MRRDPGPLCKPNQKPKPTKRQRQFDPYWADKDDIDEDGLTDNPDWLVGAD